MRSVLRPPARFEGGKRDCPAIVSARPVEEDDVLHVRELAPAACQLREQGGVLDENKGGLVVSQDEDAFVCRQVIAFQPSPSGWRNASLSGVAWTRRRNISGTDLSSARSARGVPGCGFADPSASPGMSDAGREQRRSARHMA